jgi:hypothetical protein
VFVTVNPIGLLATPFTVTLTETAPRLRLGTVAEIELLDHAVTVAAVRPNFTLLSPCEAPKAVPEMVTELPAIPVVGLIAVSVSWVLALA